MPRVEIERQQRARLARLRLLEVQEWISKQETAVSEENARQKAEEEARLLKAICRIQAGGRGYLTTSLVARAPPRLSVNKVLSCAARPFLEGAGAGLENGNIEQETKNNAGC